MHAMKAFVVVEVL